MIFKTKDDINLRDMLEWQPGLLILFTATVLWCKESGVSLYISSLKSDRSPGTGVTNSHNDNRAFDMYWVGHCPKTGDSLWNGYQRARFCHFMNTNYRDIAAISRNDLIARAAVDEQDHIHVQVRPNAPWQRFVKS